MKWSGASLVLCSLAVCSPWASATAPEVSPSATHPLDPIEALTELTVETREPRYVAPTRRDQIGRIWAPVIINGRGPFKMVLDTGASSSGVTAMVAIALGLPTDKSPQVMMRGVTGSAKVPTIHVDSVSVGELSFDQATLPIVPDALGGAEGVLGAEGLAGKRIFIDFRNDAIDIAYSKNERSARGFIVVPFHSLHGSLVVIDAIIGEVQTKAIIDTGGQATVANIALKEALEKNNNYMRGQPDSIEGATKATQQGEYIKTPKIEMGAVQILDPGITYANLEIFKQWKLTRQPAILIGMDTLGLLDTLVIDYRRHELQMRMHHAG